MTSVPLVSLLLSVAMVVVICRAVAVVATRFGQPPVVGEIIAGILVGPTLFHGAVTDALFPTAVRPFLSAFANVGVALFMFLVGLEFDRRIVRRHSTALGPLSVGAFVVPFALGSLLAVALLGHHPSPRPGAFVAFLGLAMAMTAFPVLARILVDRGLATTRMGGLALALAAVGDLVAWTALAVVVALGAPGGASLWRMLLLVPYGLVVAFVVPRLLRTRTVSTLPRSTLGLLVAAAVLASGAVTEWVGLHLIFGAFLLGVVIPREGQGAVLREKLRIATEPLSALLMPFYFVVAGFQVDLSRWDTSTLIDLALIIVVAMGSKLLGVYGAARLLRLGHRTAGGLAALMNTRGLTELIVLTVGLRLGLLSPELYSLMVVMAVVTTVASGPLLRAFHIAGADPDDTDDTDDTADDTADGDTADGVAVATGPEPDPAEPEPEARRRR